MPKQYIFAVDFDGTLCRGDNFPCIGKPNKILIEWIKLRQHRGHKFILWTCREGEHLEKAVEWCRMQGLFFDAVNENLPERIEMFGNDCRKIGADFYIDDKNLALFGILGILPQDFL